MWTCPKPHLAEQVFMDIMHGVHGLLKSTVQVAAETEHPLRRKALGARLRRRAWSALPLLALQMSSTHNKAACIPVFALTWTGVASRLPAARGLMHNSPQKAPRPFGVDLATAPPVFIISMISSA
ncbi:unnamed protein product [Symbiodinium sp. CCMP2592]|nr:unnamed protein product [Symbiodinium sp. CCMP2592]